MVVVSVGDEMERLSAQVSDRGERKDEADNSLCLLVHSAGQTGRKFSVHCDRCSFGEGSTMEVSCSSLSDFKESWLIFKWMKRTDLPCKNIFGLNDSYYI